MGHVDPAGGPLLSRALAVPMGGSSCVHASWVFTSIARCRSAGSCVPASGTAACVRMPVLWSARSPWALKSFTAYRSHPAAELPGCPGRPGQPTEPIQKASHQAIRRLGPPQRHGLGAPPSDLPSQALSLGLSVEVGDPLPDHRSRPASRRNVVVHRSLLSDRSGMPACFRRPWWARGRRPPSTDPLLSSAHPADRRIDRSVDAHLRPGC
jgi:hypothetical protein